MALEPVLTVNATARILSVKPRFVRDLIRSGRLLAFNIGNGDRPEYRVTSDAIERFIENTSTATEFTELEESSENQHFKPRITRYVLTKRQTG